MMVLCLIQGAVPIPPTGDVDHCGAKSRSTGPTLQWDEASLLFLFFVILFFFENRAVYLLLYTSCSTPR